MLLSTNMEIQNRVTLTSSFLSLLWCCLTGEWQLSRGILLSMLVDWIFQLQISEGLFFFFSLFSFKCPCFWNTNSRERTVSDCIWKMRMLTNFRSSERPMSSNNYACGYGLSLFTLRLGYTLHPQNFVSDHTPTMYWIVSVSLEEIVS